MSQFVSLRRLCISSVAFSLLSVNAMAEPIGQDEFLRSKGMFSEDEIFQLIFEMGNMPYDVLVDDFSEQDVNVGRYYTCFDCGGDDVVLHCGIDTKDALLVRGAMHDRANTDVNSRVARAVLINANSRVRTGYIDYLALSIDGAKDGGKYFLTIAIVPESLRGDQASGTEGFDVFENGHQGTVAWVVSSAVSDDGNELEFDQKDGMDQDLRARLLTAVDGLGYKFACQ
jgi:hypothetical protein